MTPKERWLASIRFEPVDRLVFWPKFFGKAYSINQCAPFNRMTNPELHDWIGSDVQSAVPQFIKTIRKNTTHGMQEDKGIRRITYGTKYGSLESILHFDTASQSWHPVKMPIESEEDVKIMTEWFRDGKAEVDRDELLKAQSFAKSLGDRALVSNSIGKSPLMSYMEGLAGLENGNYLLCDFQDEVEELFDAMHSQLLKKTEICTEYSPADVLYFIENTSTTLLSVSQYKKYCFGHIREYAGIVKGNGRILCLHMCGYLKDLLPDLAKLPVDVFEAFTSPTLGNTTLLDGRSSCPDKCLIGGTNAILWIQKSSEIIEQIEKDLDVLPHHRGIVLSSAGVMPPACSPETIREVCEWVKGYRVRI